MDLAQIFYLTATIFFVVFTIGILFVIYQLYMFRKFLENKYYYVSNFFETIAATRYTAQYAISKFLLNLFQGGDEE